MRTLTAVPLAKGFRVSMKQPSGPRSAVRARNSISDFGSNTSALAVNGLRLLLRRSSFSFGFAVTASVATSFVVKLISIAMPI